MSKRRNFLKATTALILCSGALLVGSSLYHSLLMMSAVHKNKNNNSNNHSNDASDSSIPSSSTDGDVPSSFALQLTDDNTNSQISNSLASAAATIFPTYSSNLPSGNESTTATIGPLLLQHDPALFEWKLSSPFFVNYIMRTQPPIHANCHRKCVDFRNKIYFSTPMGDTGAGLIDRLTIIATLLNMAGYLCARLYVPRPKFLLSANHNSNKQKLAATNITWSEFGTFVLWNDPEQQNALIDWVNPNDVEEWPLLETLQDEPADLFQYAKLVRHVKNQFPVFEKFTFTQQQRLASVANNNNNNNANTQADSNNQTDRFIWRIQAEFFDWDDLLTNYLRNRQLPEHYQQNELERLKEPFIFACKRFYIGCQYAKVEPPRHLQELQEKIVEQIFLRPSFNRTRTSLMRPPIVGYFHVRRQDTKQHCNTEVARIKEFLTCSLGEAISQLSKGLPSSDTSSSSSQSIIVLFSSDETDQQYRQEVMKLTEEQQSHSQETSNSNNNTRIHVTAIDLDHLVKETLRADVENGRIPTWRQNNFYAFQLVLSIGFNQSMVKFHMEQRAWDHCKPCNNVTDQLMQAGLLDGYYSMENDNIQEG